MNQKIVNVRDNIWLPNELLSRKDYTESEKYALYNILIDDFLEYHAKGMGIKHITDDIGGYDIKEYQDRIIVAGIPFYKTKKDFSGHIRDLIAGGVPFLLITGKKMHCDFIEIVEFNNKQGIKFSCHRRKTFINKHCIRRKKRGKRIYKQKICDQVIDSTDNPLFSIMLLILKRLNNHSDSGNEAINETEKIGDVEYKVKKRYPIFRFSFLLDFILWQRVFGETLVNKRIEEVKKETEEKTKRLKGLCTFMKEQMSPLGDKN